MRRRTCRYLSICTYLVVLSHVDCEPVLGAEELAARGTLHHAHGRQVALAQHGVRLQLTLVVKSVTARLTAVQSRKSNSRGWFTAFLTAMAA